MRNGWIPRRRVRVARGGNGRQVTRPGDCPAGPQEDLLRPGACTPPTATRADEPVAPRNRTDDHGRRHDIRPGSEGAVRCRPDQPSVRESWGELGARPEGLCCQDERQATELL